MLNKIIKVKVVIVILVFFLGGCTNKGSDNNRLKLVFLDKQAIQDSSVNFKEESYTVTEIKANEFLPSQTEIEQNDDEQINIHKTNLEGRINSFFHIDDKDNLYYIGLDGALYAVRIGHDYIKWKFHTKNQIEICSFKAGQSTAYCRSSKTVHALDVTTGKEKWKFISDSNISFVFERYKTVFIKKDNILCALEPSSGKIRWKINALSLPVFDRGIPYFLCGEKSICAVDTHTGAKTWELYTGVQPKIISVFNGSVLYFNPADIIYSVDIETGKEKWKFIRDSDRDNSDGDNSDRGNAVDMGIQNTGTANGTFWFIVHFEGPMSTSYNVMYLLDMETGKLISSYGTGYYNQFPDIRDGKAYISDINESGKSIGYAIDIKTGRKAYIQSNENWDITTEDDGTVSVVKINIGKKVVEHKFKDEIGFLKILDDSLIMKSDKYLQAFSLKTGREIWKTGYRGNDIISLVTLKNIIYFVSEHGVIYEFNLKTGIFTWQFKT